MTSDPKLAEAVRIVREQTIPALAGSGGGGHVDALETVLAALESDGKALVALQEATGSHNEANQWLGVCAAVALLKMERDEARGALVAAGAWQADRAAVCEDRERLSADVSAAQHQEALDIDALGKLENERDEALAQLRQAEILSDQAEQELEQAQRERDEARAEVGRLHEALERLLNAIDNVHADERYKTAWIISQLHVGPYAGPTYVAEYDAARAAIAPAQPEEQRCACGVPGAGLERECHGDYYDGETFAMDPGGEFKPTNVCACGCHRPAQPEEPKP